MKISSPSLQLKLTYKLALTPSMRQSLRLLQCSAAELKIFLFEQISSNPFLQQSDGYADQSAILNLPAVDHVPSGLTQTNELYVEQASQNISASTNESTHDFAAEMLAVPEPSLYDQLHQQARLLRLPERMQALIEWLIEFLDEEGFLRVSLDEVAQALVKQLQIDVSVAEFAEALKYLQQMEPSGVGASSVQECLLLQLLQTQHSETQIPLVTLEENVNYRQGRGGCSSEKNSIQIAYNIVQNFFSLLQKKDFVRLQKKLNCSQSALQQALHCIQSLRSKPFSHYEDDRLDYLMADMYSYKNQQAWQVAFSEDDISRLKCAEFTQEQQALFDEQQQQQWLSAQLLLKQLHDRRASILKITQAIVDYHQHFFEYGEMVLQPLVLSQIAAIVKMHPSTISRAITGKSLQTPHGVYPLKYFFTGRIATDVGGNTSALIVRNLIRQWIDSEAKNKPLSDQKLTDQLAAEGILIARRTVAKYRAMLEFLPASLRKIKSRN